MSDLEKSDLGPGDSKRDNSNAPDRSIAAPGSTGTNPAALGASAVGGSSDDRSSSIAHGDAADAAAGAASPEALTPPPGARADTANSHPASKDIVVLPPLGRSDDRRSSAPRGDSDDRSTTGLFLKAAAVLVVLGGAGALAATGIAHFGSPNSAAAESARAAEAASLKQTVARLESEVATLRASIDQSAKANVTQNSRITERFDRIEKAQAEPAARLAKLSDAVDRLSKPAAQASAAAPAATVAAASSDVTGSVPAPSAEPRKPPVLDGWTLRNVSDGGALIQGPFGMFDVYPGDPLPGMNRVEAIRREGGRWVVVTRKGWIVAR